MTVASVTFVHAHSLFLLPHLKMLENLVDKRIVIYGRQMWPPYLAEHGKMAGDNTRELLEEAKKMGCQVEETDIIQHDGQSFADLYNFGIFLSQDCDYSMRLDVDMYLTQEDQAKLKAQLQQNVDVINLNHTTNSINYYVDFDHGLRDAKEHESLAISTKNKYLSYLKPEKTDRQADVHDITVHHFRGWNKPKSTTKTFFESEYALKQLETQTWLSCPQEIREMLAESGKPWLEFIKWKFWLQDIRDY